jgi:hypothetical protein
LYLVGVDLLYAYPAILGGLAAGYVAARRGWSIQRVLAAGASLFVILVVHQTTVPEVLHGEGEPITAPLWVAVAFANAGSWVFGTGIGAALAWSSRHMQSP